MSSESLLSIAADVAAIITACVALFAYLAYRFQQRSRRIRLEQYLQEEKDRGWGDQGRTTVTELMAHLGMTEAEVLHAAFQSRMVRRATVTDEQGRAGDL